MADCARQTDSVGLAGRGNKKPSKDLGRALALSPSAILLPALVSCQVIIREK
jgi:hypothetical protein